VENNHVLIPVETENSSATSVWQRAFKKPLQAKPLAPDVRALTILPGVAWERG
jgi:hypothetical protein